MAEDIQDPITLLSPVELKDHILGVFFQSMKHSYHSMVLYILNQNIGF